MVYARISPTAPVIGTGADGRKLDAAGHRWYASLCWAKQTDLIGKADEWPEHGAELAEVAKQWKAMAEAHQARAFVMEPETRMG